MSNTQSLPLPIYPRIVSYCGLAYGEDMRCVPCAEIRAVCPDCESAVCVTCEDACAECEAPLF